MIVIVGGTGRLGKELVARFKSDGKVVVNVSRHSNEQADHNILHDLVQAGETLAAAKEILAIEESIEVVINAAGFYHSAPFGSISDEEATANMTVHAKAPLVLVSHLMDRIKKDGTDIVNISSIAGVQPATDAPAYGASKWALRGFSASLQAELKKFPSRVISFCPAAFDVVDKSQMDTSEVADFIKQILELPKNMEVSEIIVNLKPTDKL